jgi:hypothetical protein
MWPTTSSTELRALLPDVALKLETATILHNLRAQELIVNKRISGKKATLVIELNDDYQVHLMPVDIGALGFYEWLSWYQAPVENDPDSFTMQSSMRCRVVLRKKNSIKTDELASFTIHKDNPVEIVRTALSGIFHETGLKLQPKMPNRKNK